MSKAICIVISFSGIWSEIKFKKSSFLNLEGSIFRVEYNVHNYVFICI